MAQDLLHRPLAIAFAEIPPPIRGQLLSLLPAAVQEGIRSVQDSVDGLTEDDLTIPEWSLLQDALALFGDGKTSAEADTLPLRLADILALVLSGGKAGDVAAIIRRLPAEVESETLHLIGAQGWDALVRRSDSDVLPILQELATALGGTGRQADPEFVAEVLRYIKTPAVIRRVLTDMFDKDPDSASHVQELLYGFNDLVKLSDRELQSVLQGVDHWDLILALRPAPTAFRRKVLANLSERRAALVQEDEKTLEEVDDAQVEMLQHQILDRARLLYENGVVRTYMGSVRSDEVVEAVETHAPIAGGAQPVKHLSNRKKKKTQRNYLVGLLVGISTIAIALLGLMWFSSGKHKRVAESTRRSGIEQPENEADSTRADEMVTPASRRNLARAAVISGRALLMSGDRVRDLDKGTVEPGDRVTTGEDGKAAVELGGDAGQLQIEPETDVELLERETAQTESPRLQVRVGNLWVQVKDPSLEVSSPVADVSGAEGAIFNLRIALNAATTVTVHAGTVWVRPRSEAIPDPLILSAGERVRLLPNGTYRRTLHNDPMELKTP